VYGNPYEHNEDLALKNGANFFHMPASTIYYKYLQLKNSKSNMLPL
jgi:hypothetical protein